MITLNKIAKSKLFSNEEDTNSHFYVASVITIYREIELGDIRFNLLLL